MQGGNWYDKIKSKVISFTPISMIVLSLMFNSGCKMLKGGIKKFVPKNILTNIQKNYQKRNNLESLANKYYKENNFELASKHFNKAIEESPYNVELRLKYAYSLGENGEYDESIEQYKKAVNMGINEAKNAYIFYENEGGRYYTRALENEWESWGKKDYGETFDVNYSIENYRKAAKLDPTNPAPNCMLGGMYKRLNQPQKAEEEFRKSIKILPEFPEVHGALGDLLFEQGQYERARYELKAYLIFKRYSKYRDETLEQIKKCSEILGK